MISSKSFQKNLLLSVGGIFVLFAICFIIYQYNREKDYKIDIMQSRLQMYSYEMLHTLGNKEIMNAEAVRNYVKNHNVEGIRVTLIGLDGKVILDSKQADVSKMESHLHRKEVMQALKTGKGFDIKRTSQSTHQTYFYSATKTDNFIIRVAIPYSTELTRSLKADYSFIYFTIFITVLLGVVLYYNTSRIGKHIGYLREFAVEAEHGDALDHELERQLPDDELGDISHTIIALYWKLRHSEEDKVRIKRQLTMNAAHELKTPAASIHGYLESILENPDMPVEKRQHFLERCYAQSERMSKLLLDMAALTKLDDIDSFTYRHSEPTIVDVRSVIQNVLDDTQIQLQAKGIETSLSVPDHILIPGDLNYVYSIFRNLVDNALAYAAGATMIRIVCSECVVESKYARDKDGKRQDASYYYEFTFSDNGVGVEQEHLQRIFERFYRVDKGRSRKLGGTGLGLAIVKNAVAVHGGTTVAEQTPGGGLTIRFTLLR